MEDIEAIGKNSQMLQEYQHQRESVEANQTKKKKEDQLEMVMNEVKSLRLAALKKKWREERQKRKNFSLEKIQMETSDLQAYAEQLENRIKKTDWLVLRISPINEGVLKFWILVDNKVMMMRNVNAFRKIYVNSYEKNETEMKVSQKRLPREKTVFHLYEFEIQDQDYQETMNQMNYYLTNSSIEGVYETQVDLDFRAIVQVENICRINNKHYKDQAFNLTSIESVKNKDALQIFYQNIFEGPVKLIYVWTIQVQNKHLALVVSQDSLSILKCFRKEKEDPQYKSQFKNFAKEKARKILGEDSFINIDLLSIKYENFD